MFKISGLFILLVLTLSSLSIVAQQATHYDISDGLAHQQVKALFQDSKGYLWIGTWDGLNRFDGHTFTTYRHDPGDSTTIFNDEVIHITEDSSHMIWILNLEGLSKFNALENNFMRVYLRPSHEDRIICASRNVLAFDKNNRGWLLDSEGLIGFDVNLTEFRYYDVSSFFKKYGAIIADGRGLWFGTTEGLFHFTFDVLEQSRNLDTQLADQIYLFSEPDEIEIIISLIQTSYGRFAVNVNRREIFVSNNQSGKLEKVPIPFRQGNRLFNIFGGMCELSPGKHGLCTDDKGIHILDLQTKSFDSKHPLQQIVGKQKVFTLYKDRQQNYWVGTQNGLIKYSTPQLDYDAWLYGAEARNSLSGRFVSSIFRDSSDHLWVACKGGGLDCIDLQNNSITNVQIDAIGEMGGDLKTVRYIYGPDEDHLLIVVDSMLFIRNKKTKATEMILSIPGSFYKIFQDRIGRLWIGGNRQIFLAGYQEGKVFITDTLNTNARCRDIIETRNNEIYFATQKGLTKLDSTVSGLMKTFVPPGSEMDPEIFCIHENSNGTLWAGSIRSGISLFDPEQERFIKHFNTENGLIDNSVNAFMEDDQGFLWLSTWKGIVRFDPVGETFENFGKINGLPVWDFTTGAFLWDDRGRIIFGGMGGVIRFHPDSLVRFIPGYDLKIVGVNTGNKRLPLDYPLKKDEVITLDSDQRDFSMEFSSFDFRNPDQRIYRYKLNGFERKWKTTATNDFTARYSGISPGLYAFELQSAYHGRPWIEEPTRLMIRVKPPPVFQRKSFQTGILLTLGLALATILFMRLRYVNMRKEVIISRLEKDANQSRLNFLKSQMNPHFYFNTLNAINSFILKHEMREANRFLTTFAKLMREILENSQKEFVQICDEKEVLEKYLSLQQLRFPGLFHYTVVVDEEVAQKLIPPMLLQPFVENSVEYAFLQMKHSGQVKVSFSQAAGGILCEVLDNGIGIERSQQIRKNANRKSTAIKNIYKRIEMLNTIYNLNINLDITALDPENEDFPGTFVRLILPDFGKIIET